MTKTNESCSKIMNLELQDLNASTNVVAYNSGAATIRSHSALIPVNQLITKVVLIATYHGGIIRSSNQINSISTCIYGSVHTFNVLLYMQGYSR